MERKLDTVEALAPVVAEELFGEFKVSDRHPIKLIISRKPYREYITNVADDGASPKKRLVSATLLSENVPVAKRPRMAWQNTPSTYFSNLSPPMEYDTVEAASFAVITQQIARLTDALRLKIQSIDMNLTVLNKHPIDCLNDIECEVTREANRIQLMDDFMTIYHLRCANDVQVNDLRIASDTMRYLLINYSTSTWTKGMYRNLWSPPKK